MCQIQQIFLYSNLLQSKDVSTLSKLINTIRQQLSANISFMELLHYGDKFIRKSFHYFFFYV